MWVFPGRVITAAERTINRPHQCSTKQGSTSNRRQRGIFHWRNWDKHRIPWWLVIRGDLVMWIKAQKASWFWEGNHSFDWNGKKWLGLTLTKLEKLKVKHFLFHPKNHQAVIFWDSYFNQAGRIYEKKTANKNPLLFTETSDNRMGPLKSSKLLFCFHSSLPVLWKQKQRQGWTKFVHQVNQVSALGSPSSRGVIFSP